MHFRKRPSADDLLNEDCVQAHLNIKHHKGQQKTG
jgi:hypothetical protein